MGINQGTISLDQKYTQGSGHVFLTGIQALVRLPMAQIRRDRANGLNTAGFISGYRGSPLGGYDQQLFAARNTKARQEIRQSCLQRPDARDHRKLLLGQSRKARSRHRGDERRGMNRLRQRMTPVSRIRLLENRCEATKMTQPA